MVGLVAAALGATVILTDQAPILQLLASNSGTLCDKCNIGHGKVRTQLYDWGGDLDWFHEQDIPFDVILISDCVLPKLYPIEPLIKAGSCLRLRSLCMIYITPIQAVYSLSLAHIPPIYIF